MSRVKSLVKLFGQNNAVIISPLVVFYKTPLSVRISPVLCCTLLPTCLKIKLIWSVVITLNSVALSQRALWSLTLHSSPAIWMYALTLSCPICVIYRNALS